MSRLFGLLITGVVLTLLAGCSPAGGPPDANRPEPNGGGRASILATATPPHPGGAVAVPIAPVAPSDEATYAKPGVYELPRGRAQVLGTLEYGSVSGAAPGYWVCASYPWESKPLVPLARLEGADERQAYSNRGRFVSVDGRLEGSAFAVDQFWSVDEDPGPFDWRHARMEKPHQTRLPDDRLRAVGLLAYLKGYRDVETDRWAVMLAVPGQSPFGTARVGAFLETPPPPSLLTSEFPYVAVEGTITGGIRVSGTVWPIVRASALATVVTEPGFAE